MRNRTVSPLAQLQPKTALVFIVWLPERHTGERFLYKLEQPDQLITISFVELTQNERVVADLRQMHFSDQFPRLLRHEDGLGPPIKRVRSAFYQTAALQAIYELAQAGLADVKHCSKLTLYHAIMP